MTTASFRLSTPFRDAARRQESWLAPMETRCLRWLAQRTPLRVGPDHLTLLGFIAMFFAGACYGVARWWPPALLLVNFWLAVNWLGDSMDGTLARARQRQRPRALSRPPGRGARDGYRLRARRSDAGRARGHR